MSHYRQASPFHVVAIVAASLSLAACSHTPPPERVQVVAAVAPPEARREARGRAPRAGYVWVAGYWNLVSGRHIWVPGFWAVPPRGFSSWDAAHWIRDRNGGWVLIRGRWK